MVTTRSGGRGRHAKEQKQEEAVEEDEKIKDEYEESRAKRIKENSEKMETLGLPQLSKELQSSSSKPPSSLRKTPTKSSLSPTLTPRKTPTKSSVSPNLLPRRSPRLRDVPTVSYSEKRTRKTKEKSVDNVGIIPKPDRENPEIYTEDDEKLLGDSKAVWELYVDGFDEDGQLIYDPDQGKTCHQCRLKTMRHHTECSKCQEVTGQLCGDCLYMRYGEHVLEVSENPDWICPVCRGICNCNRCRIDKGWEPVGAIYKKVASNGYKSVAQYLIYTRRGGAIVEAESGDKSIVPASVDKKNEVEEGDMKNETDDASQ